MSIEITAAPPNQGRCRRNEWQCANGECISDEFYCDGIKDCTDFSDEHENCTSQKG